jgi:RNA polymerase sigma-70 factor (ECF subfamily)
MMSESVAATALPNLATPQTARLDTTDEAIAARGDAASFAELYRRHVEAVYRYAASRVATRDEAEDVTSDAFHRAWSSFHTYRASSTFRAWLFGVARRAIADHYRKTKPTVRLVPETAAQLADDNPNPEESAVRRELERRGAEILARLKPDQQEILSLRFAARLSYPEIAQVMKKREDAVKKAAYRALEEMKKGMTL